MAISKYLSEVYGEMMGVGRGRSPSDHLRLFMKALALSISNQMKPFLKFLRNHFYKKKTLYPPRAYLHPLPLMTMGGVSSSKT